MVNLNEHYVLWLIHNAYLQLVSVKIKIEREKY